jgi:hypothetical protein
MEVMANLPSGRPAAGKPVPFVEKGLALTLQM